jgi:hypothetical protein
LEISLAHAVQGRKGVGTACVPGACKHGFELIEPAPRHVDQQFVAVAKMPVRRGRTHSRPSRSFREGKAGGPFLGNQLERRADQGLFQIAVVIAAGPERPPCLDQLM